MTNIIIRKIEMDDGTSVATADQIPEGMRKAGNKINSYLRQAGKPKRRLVRHLYKQLIEKSVAQGNDGVYEMGLINAAGDFLVLTPAKPNKYRKFVSADEPDLVVKLIVQIDDEGYDEDDDFIKMNVIVPAGTQDFVANGYINQVVADIDKISGSTLSNKTKIKKYLLSNIFLSRCH